MNGTTEAVEMSRKVFHTGISFRKLKKALKKRDGDGTLHVLSGVYVDIRFSKEIHSWDGDTLYENPKFWQFWDTFNRRIEKHHDRYGYFRVVYSNLSSQKACEADSRKEMFACRWLIWNDNALFLQPQMDMFYIIRPCPFHTFPMVGVGCLKNIMEDCARYCGGTCEFSFTETQRFPFFNIKVKTLTLGLEEKKSNI